jgi:hypothetical protein
VAVFADSSALVKLYADERDHELIRDLDCLVVATMVRVEVPGAIWRKMRTGELAAADAAVLVAAFEADYHGSPEHRPRFGAVAATADVLDTAARLVGVHDLHPADALQLASAKAAAQAVPDCRTLASFSAALRSAAAAEGFALVPTRTEPHTVRKRPARWPRSWPRPWPLNRVLDVERGNSGSDNHSLHP